MEDAAAAQCACSHSWLAEASPLVPPGLEEGANTVVEMGVKRVQVRNMRV